VHATVLILAVLGPATRPSAPTTAPTRSVRIEGLDWIHVRSTGNWLSCPVTIELREGDWIDTYKVGFPYGGEEVLRFEQSIDERQTWVVAGRGRRLIALDATGPAGLRLLSKTRLEDLKTLHHLVLDVPLREVADALAHVEWSHLELRIEPRLLFDDIQWERWPVQFLKLPSAVITDPAPLAKLTSLKRLLVYSSGISDLGPLEKLTALEELSLYHCWRVTDLRPLESLRGLHTLRLDNCESVTDLAPLGRLLSTNRFRHLALPPKAGTGWLRRMGPNWARQTDLEVLVLSGDEITDLSPLRGLTGLRRLSVGGCGELADISDLAHLKGLRALDLTACGQVESLEPIRHLRNLRSIRLKGCRRVRDLAPLGTLLKSCQLVQLSLPPATTDKWLRRLAPLLARQADLTELSLSSCGQITDLRPLSGAIRLRYLGLTDCDGITDLEPLRPLRNLRRLYFYGSGGVSDLSPLAEMRELQFLGLSGCTQVRDLSPLAGMTRLKGLFINGCSGVTDVSPLAGLADLLRLNLGRCTGIHSLSPLHKLRNLESLYLDGCTGLSELTSLEGIIVHNRLLNLMLPPTVTDKWLKQVGPSLAKQEGLRSLHLWNCATVTEIGPLAGLAGLRTLSLADCPHISDVSALGKLRRLRGAVLV